MTWHNNHAVFLEVHKGRKDYLFDYKRCLDYIKTMEMDSKEKGLLLLNRISELL